jgi:hypothetical protein
MSGTIKEGGLMPILEKASEVLQSIPEELIPNRKIIIDYQGNALRQVHVERPMPRYRIRVAFWDQALELNLLNGSLDVPEDEEKELVIRYDYEQVSHAIEKLREMIEILQQGLDLNLEDQFFPIVIE